MTSSIYYLPCGIVAHFERRRRLTQGKFIEEKLSLDETHTMDS